MSTHCNFAFIQPQHDGHYRVCISRGRLASGNPEVVVFDEIAGNLSLQDAAMVVRAAPHIWALNFAEYAPAHRTPEPRP